MDRNEAIDIVRKNWPDGRYQLKEALETLIPELKESEDERIRKTLIDLIKCNERSEYSSFNNVNTSSMLAWLERQGAQKSTDNTEPKFKIGDWVVYKNEVCQIKHREEGYNLLTNSFGINKEPINERLLSTAHIWSIADAKDGDVLAVNNEVFIYAHRKQMYSIAVAHCFVDSAGGFYLDGEFRYVEYGKTTSPATKEQRDLLFSKMHEAGYEWDSEKKELKKIEKKFAWSEEDEKILNEFIESLRYHNVNGYNKQVDWLKSIKDRVQSNHWKPSDEQIKALGIAIRCGIQLGTWEEEALKSLKEQLKKLKEE